MYKNALSQSVSVSELRQMRDSGMTNREIAKQLDVHPSTVGRYLGPADMQTRSRHRNQCREITPELIADIQRLFGEGRSINSIAERFGVGWQTVKKIVTGTKREPERTEEPAVQSPAEPVPAAAPVEQETPKGEEPMLQIISRRQTIRMQGAECQYLLELGSGADTVTIVNADGKELAVLDAEGLAGFMGELGRILRALRGEAA